MQSQPRERIAGWDLFVFEMNRLNEKGGRCMFMGSSEKVLALIKQRAAVDYPNLEVVTYSPPYKPEFSQEVKLLLWRLQRGKPVCCGWHDCSQAGKMDL